MHYRAMFDSPHIGAWDLSGRDIVVRISKVEAGTITGGNGRTAKKPIIYFEGKQKGMVCNKTNAKVIASLYGSDTREWVGKRIVLFPTTTQMGSETTDCIRVRNRIPEAKAEPKQELTEQSAEESADASE